MPKELSISRVEVQGYSDKHFAKRMFEYAYRIRDRYQLPLVALAVYTDEYKKYHFKEYREFFLDTELTYRFRTFSIIDYSPEELGRSKNLFGMVLETARRELDCKQLDDEKRLQIKVQLVRNLISRGITKKKIRHLLDFIEHYINFEKADFFDNFEKEIQPIIKQRESMGIREAILKEVEENGMEKGLAKGLEQGLEQGLAIKSREVVVNGFKIGLAADNLAKLTGLDLQAVEEIIAEYLASLPGESNHPES